MNNDLIAKILVFGGGIFSILASVLNLNFFFENRKAKIFVTIFGRTGARVFYIILGIFIIVLGLKIYY